MINFEFHADRDACNCRTPDFPIQMQVEGEQEPRTYVVHIPDPQSDDAVSDRVASALDTLGLAAYNRSTDV